MTQKYHVSTYDSLRQSVMRLSALYMDSYRKQSCTNYSIAMLSDEQLWKELRNIESNDHVAIHSLETKVLRKITEYVLYGYYWMQR